MLRNPYLVGDSQIVFECARLVVVTVATLLEHVNIITDAHISQGDQAIANHSRLMHSAVLPLPLKVLPFTPRNFLPYSLIFTPTLSLWG